MDGIIVGITLILCIAQFIVCVFVEPKIPIKLKETDTLQRIRKRKNNYLRIILVVGIFTIILAYYGVKNQILIFGMIFGFFLIFLLTGANTIFDRIEKKEKLFLAEHTISILNDSSIKNIVLKDEELRESIIKDSIEKINLTMYFKEGEEYLLKVREGKLMPYIGNTFREEILQKNIESIEVEELKENEIKLKVRTKTGNTFQKDIEKWELSQCIAIK